MGMGEPLLNYDATVAALRVLMDPEGFAVAPEKLTLSTVGILPALEKLMQEPVRPEPRHQPARAERGAAARAHAHRGASTRCADVIAAAQRYPIPRGGLRDLRVRAAARRQRHARRTRASWCGCCAGARGKVNLIPLNPAPEIPFERAHARRRSTRSAASWPRRTSRSRCGARAGRTSWPPAASSTCRRGARAAAAAAVLSAP